MIQIKSLASGSKGNCYWINDGTSPLLIEAGIPISKIKRKLNYNLSQIDGCLISHQHLDHSKAVNNLASFGVECFMNKETAEVKINHHRIAIIKPERGQFNLANWIVKPFETEHDVESLGFLLYSQYSQEKLVYITDSIYSKYTFPGLNYIMIEVNYSREILNDNVEKRIIPPEQKNRVMRSHMSLETTKELLEANDLSEVKEIYLLHLSDDNSDAEKFKKEVQNLTGKPTFIA